MGSLKEDLAGLTMGRFLAERAERNGDRTCLTFLHDGEKVSFREFAKRCNRVANGLKGLGIVHGDNVAVLSDNRPEQLYAYFGLAQLGAASVPVVTSAKGYFLQRFVGQSDSVAIIMEPEFFGNLEAVIDELPQLRTIIVLRSLESDTIPEVPASLAHLETTTFEAVMEASDASIDEARPADRAQILYTSGTTGPSKGNVYPHSAILAWARSAADVRGYGAEDVALVVFPLFHAGAWLNVVMPMLWIDGSSVLGRRFSASNFLQQARENDVTVAFVVAVSSFLAAQPPSPNDRNHKLWQLTTAPMPPDPIGFEERFGFRLTAGYALSDYGSSHAFKVTDPREKLGSAGRLKEDWEMRIVDDNGYEVEPGQPGEIWLRCNIVGGTPTGYYKMPEATLESRQDLWFHTGDFVREDEDGYLWFVDRKKDAIRRRGENISSVELEAVLGRHEAVAGSAFFAVRAIGEEDDVAVAIIAKAGVELKEESIIAYCEQHMPKFAIPRYVRIMESMPQTGSGKVEKHKLRAETEASLATVWDRLRARDA